MSIYPVRLNEWFPPGDEHFEIVSSFVEFNRCLACGDSPNYKKAVGHHSIFVGYGDVWCSWKCCHSGKIARPDKRRERRLNRNFKVNFERVKLV